MFDYFIIYEKNDRVKYISHLDFLRAFGRTVRRAALPVAFSQGFNPHPLINIPLPLSTGYTGENEIVDLSLSREMPEDEMISKLNSALPEGIKVTSACRGKSRAKEAAIAKYAVTPENAPPDSVAGLLGMAEILIDKKTKSGVKLADIRPDIFSLSVEDGKILLLLSVGSARNLKPDVVVAAINKYVSDYDSGDCEYRRLGFYDNKMNPIR